MHLFRLFLFCSVISLLICCNNSRSEDTGKESTVSNHLPMENAVQKESAQMPLAESQTAVPDSLMPLAESQTAAGNTEALRMPLDESQTATGFWEQPNSDLATLLMSKIMRVPAQRNKLTDILVKTERDQQHRAMARLAGMEEHEIKLLEQMPTKEFVNNEQIARAVLSGSSSKDIDAWQREGKSSELFEKIVVQNQKTLKKHSTDMLKKVDQARETFQKNNPKLNLSSGNTYFDEKNNAVHLPMGKLSFADEVIAHSVGKPAGKYAARALGTPDYKGDETQNIAHVGYGGKLTLYFKDNAIVDVSGPDIYVFEVGAIEPTELEISKDGSNWIKIGKINGGTAEVDIAGFVPTGENYHYVRFTDLKSPSDIPGADIDAVACIGSVMRLTLNSAVLFDFGKYELKPEADTALQSLAKKIKSMPGGLITVEGHTDDVGQDASNKTLSEKRAESVSAALKILIPNQQFKWKILGLGETRPLKPNDTEEHRQENRRVEILVQPQN